MWIDELIENALYNARLYRSGRANRNEVHSTTVGWRRDPWNEDDGYEEDPCPPSHNENGEYYRVIRSEEKGNGR